jgi:hypothetical protein
MSLTSWDTKAKALYFHSWFPKVWQLPFRLEVAIATNAILNFKSLLLLLTKESLKYAISFHTFSIISNFLEKISRNNGSLRKSKGSIRWNLILWIKNRAWISAQDWPRTYTRENWNKYLFILIWWKSSSQTSLKTTFDSWELKIWW